MQKDDSFRQSKFSDIVRCMDLEFVQHLTVYPYPSLVQEDFFFLSLKLHSYLMFIAP